VRSTVKRPLPVVVPVIWGTGFSIRLKRPVRTRILLSAWYPPHRIARLRRQGERYFTDGLRDNSRTGVGRYLPSAPWNGRR
jgi:hypothetical protein